MVSFTRPFARARAPERSVGRLGWYSLITCLAAATFAAPAMARRFREQPTLDAMISRSDAIVVCNVLAVDEQASADPAEPLTSVTCAVDEVLRGRLPASRQEGQLELLFRGGVTATGLRLRFTSVPHLAAGDRYVLFLRSDYYVSPILPAPQALIREASVAGASVAVDENGRALVASRTFGLVTAEKVAAALDEKAGAPFTPETGNSLQPEDSSAAQPRSQASSFDSVRELIRARASLAPAPGAALLATIPLSLPAAPAQRDPNQTSIDSDDGVQPSVDPQGGGDK